MRKINHGFTLIELMIVVAIIAIIAAIAIPNLLEARKSSNEASAIGSMRAIATAQGIYRESDKDGNGTLDYAMTIPALVTYGSLIDSKLGNGSKEGYWFSMGVANQFEWSASAGPSSASTGSRYFYVDQTGVIRFSSTIATSQSTPLGG